MVIAVLVGLEFCDSSIAFTAEVAVEVAAQLARTLGLRCGLDLGLWKSDGMLYLCAGQDC